MIKWLFTIPPSDSKPPKVSFTFFFPLLQLILVFLKLFHTQVELFLDFQDPKSLDLSLHFFLGQLYELYQEVDYQGLSTLII